MTEAVIPSLTLRFAPCVDAARRVSARIREFVVGCGAEEADGGAWELVAAELLANIVVHGQAEGCTEDIHVEVHVSPEWARLRVVDPTEGFDWPDDVSLPDPESESGRGLFIIHSLVDDVRYQRREKSNLTELRRDHAGNFDRQGGPSSPETEAPALPAENSSASSPDSEVLESLQIELDGVNQVLEDMSEELASNYESLSAIFRFSADLGRTSDTSVFTREFLTRLLDATTAEWYLVRLFDPAEESLVFQACSRENTSETAQRTVGLQDAVALEADAARRKRDHWFKSAEEFAESDPIKSLVGGYQGILHPIVLEDELVGTVVAARRDDLPPFTAGQLSTIHTLSDFFAIQIINERYKREAILAERQVRDLEIASDIQRSLLPQVLPQIPALDLSTYFESASSVGGDFFDVLYDVVPQAGGQGVLLSIADVMGKGVPAALFAAILRTSIRSMAELAATPGRLMSRLNNVLYPDLNRVDMFITVQLVYLDFKNASLSIATAGHCPLVRWDAAKQEVEEVTAEGVPIGVLEDFDYSVTETSWNTGDKALMFSDGLIEARGHDGELLGMEAVTDFMGRSELKGLTCDEITKRLLSRVESHQDDTPQSDDLTFILMAHL